MGFVQESNGPFAQYVSCTSNDAESLPTFFVDVSYKFGPGEVPLTGEPNNLERGTFCEEAGRQRKEEGKGGDGSFKNLPDFLSRGFFRNCVMSWCLDRMSASVFPVLNVTSQAFAQAAIAERSREREVAMEARSLTEGFLFLKEIDHKITTTYKCSQATKLLKRQSDLLCLHPIVPTASLLAQKIKTYLTQS